MIWLVGNLSSVSGSCVPKIWSLKAPNASHSLKMCSVHIIVSGILQIVHVGSEVLFDCTCSWYARWLWPVTACINTLYSYLLRLVIRSYDSLGLGSGKKSFVSLHLGWPWRLFLHLCLQEKKERKRLALALSHSFNCLFFTNCWAVVYVQKSGLCGKL